MKFASIPQDIIRLYFDKDYASRCNTGLADSNTILNNTWQSHNDVKKSGHYIVTSIDTEEYNDEKYDFIPSSSGIDYFLCIVIGGDIRTYVASSGGGNVIIIIKTRYLNSKLNLVDVILTDKMCGNRFGREEYSTEEIRKIMYAISHVNKQFVSDCQVWGTQINPLQIAIHDDVAIKNNTNLKFIYLPLL